MLRRSRPPHREQTRLEANRASRADIAHRPAGRSSDRAWMIGRVVLFRGSCQPTLRATYAKLIRKLE
jgi:hypothetical protein